MELSNSDPQSLHWRPGGNVFDPIFRTPNHSTFLQSFSDQDTKDEALVKQLYQARGTAEKIDL